MLIVPAIHISHGRCTRTADGEKGTEGLYPYDPVQVARMWRGENAKALHVVGLDFQDAGIACAKELLHAMVHAVDIPIQVTGGLDTLDDVRTAFEDIGVLDHERIILFCGAGLGSTVDALALNLIGYENVAIYDGSLNEWGWDESLPMETG